VYSPNLINEWDFGNHRNKIVIAHEYFFEETFIITLPFSDRPSCIGYIGRLSAEKGVQNLVRALPHILGNRKDLRVLIGGDGDLMESIQKSLVGEELTDQVDLVGWISHDDLPWYLNQLQLLILPSYTEGLPTIMLQALACGTPVLATAVGAIPDIIREGKTGFIMRDNSPECIAENVIRVMSSPDRVTVALQGRRFVEDHFTFEKTRDSLRPIINAL
jgi:glycosyltransferase involved in cell wall biosynthesis